MSIGIKLLLKKNGEYSGEEAMIQAMKDARDEYGTLALQREFYSCDEDVDLNNILIDGAKDPDKLIECACEWNQKIYDRIDSIFEAVLPYYKKHPENGMAAAIKASDHDRKISTWTLSEAIYAMANCISYSSECAVYLGYSLDAKIGESDLKNIVKHPEDYFTAYVYFYGE